MSYYRILSLSLNGLGHPDKVIEAIDLSGGILNSGKEGVSRLTAQRA